MAAEGTPYRLAGHFVCHDQKFADRVEVVVTRARPPTPAEAEALLRPAAEARVVRARGDGGRVDFTGVSVAAEPWPAAAGGAGSVGCNGPA